MRTSITQLKIASMKFFASAAEPTSVSLNVPQRQIQEHQNQALLRETIKFRLVQHVCCIHLSI